jgi:cation diffusion facilitator family transporter
LENANRAQLAERAVLVGLLANVVLAVAKIVVGIAQGSQALLADGVNSTLDVTYFAATLFLVRLAGKEPDYEHPHGHAQSESVASLLIGAFIITTAAAIFYNSLEAAVAGTPGNVGALALLVATGTIIAKVALVVYTQAVAAQTENVAVGALALDHRNDILVSLTVVVGLAGASLGYPILDPLAGAAVAFFILATGIQVVREAAEDLMGTLPSGEIGRQIRAHVGRVPGVNRIDEVRAYRFGPYLVVHVEIEVDPHLSVEEGHAIADRVERTLREKMREVRQAHTHVNPGRA